MDTDKHQLLPEELALAAAWVFVVGGLVWLGVFLSGPSLLGFGAPWTWITTAHFAFAGFGALTVTSPSGRLVSNPQALSVLRLLLIARPVGSVVTAGLGTAIQARAEPEPGISPEGPGWRKPGSVRWRAAAAISRGGGILRIAGYFGFV